MILEILETQNHCNEYDKWDNDLLINLFNDWNIYYSDGETRNDVDLR